MLNRLVPALRGIALSAALLLALPLPLAAATTPAQPAVDVNAMLAETQLSLGTAEQMQIVWWLPQEFWQASLADSADMSEKERKEFLAMVEPYFLVAVVDGTISTFGAITYRDEAAIRKGLVLTSPDGVARRPIDPAKASPEVRILLGVITPILENAAGDLGKNMRFFIFDARDAGGKRIADPHQPGTLAVDTGEVHAKFRLPLASLMPPRFDAASGERFPGTYRFNPYTGIELVAQPPSQPAKP